MATEKRTTQRDVARLANVSTAVVSYVINNGPRPTSPAVRRRVLDAIQTLDYHPNVIARGLRAQRTQTIAMIVHEFHPFVSFASHYMAPIISSIVEDLAENGYYLLIHPLQVGRDASSVERLLRSGRIDGVILRMVQEAQSDQAQVLEIIRQSGLPCVCVERPRQSGFPIVSNNDEDGGIQATAHLIERGHRRIGFIGGDPRFSTAQARARGYIAQMETAGLLVDPALMVDCHWNALAAADATRRMLQLSDPPTAIFCASDDMALGSMNALFAMGLRVPEDVAIVGFDDIAQAQQLSPALTTVRIPLREIGQRASLLIRSLVEGETLERNDYVVPVELMQRETA